MSDAARPIFGLYFLTCNLWVHSGSSSGSIYDSLYWYYVNPMLSLEFNILSQNSVPSGQTWKILSQTGIFLYQMNIVSIIICMSSSKLSHFVPYFCCSQYYLLNVCLSHIFYFLSAIFIALYCQFGTYCFYVALETFSDIKLICVPNHCYWSTPFSAVTIPCIQLHICLLLFDLNLGSILPQGQSMFHFSSMWWRWESQLQLQSPLSLTSDDCGGPAPDPYPYVFVLCDLNLGGREGIHSGSNSGPIFVSPELFAYIDILLTLCYH